jgi:hypothetical protein
MKKNLLLFTLFIISPFFLFSQKAVIPKSPIRAEGLDCGQHSAHEHLMTTDPIYRKRNEEIENNYFKYAKDWMFDNRNSQFKEVSGRMANPRIVTIPVVVHVMHLSGTALGVNENVSDAQIQAGIQHLNDAFAKRAPYNTGPLYSNAGIPSADIEIQFCLATLDPSGNVTTGITRHATPYTTLYRDDIVSGTTTQDATMKALAYWSSSQYMNIYLVKDIYTCSSTAATGNAYTCPADQGIGVAGYAYFSSAHGQTYDGIVNEAAWFGTNANNSKVHVHEVGHYLNLSHTFYEPAGSGCQTGDCLTTGDKVCDTPPDNSTTAVSCPATANTCSNDATLTNSPFVSDVQDIYEDYMDYGFQSCQNTFTPGQKSRMRQALFTTRQSLLTSGKCGSANSWVDGALSSIDFPSTGTLCSSTFTPQITLRNGGNTTITAMVITSSIGGGATATYNWAGSLSASASTSISLAAMTLPSNATHSLVVQITSVNGQGIDTYEENNNLSMIVGPSANQTAPTAACAIGATNTGTTSGYQMGIYNVTFGNINNTSGDTYTEGAVYFDRVCNNITTLASLSNSISVTTGGLNTVRVKVYIDLNNDGTFQTNESLASMTGSNTLTTTFAIPCTGVTTNTLLRMRIVSDGTGNTGAACTTPQYGQIEDFGVIIPASLFPAALTSACSIAATNLGTASSFGSGIKNVTLGAINYTSSDTYNEGAVYFDRTCSQVTTLTTTSNPISVTIGSFNDERVNVFIDLNNDGAFQSSELLFNELGRGVLSGTITLPNILTRNTRLRMRVMSDLGTPAYCTKPQYGQVEDYTVIIQTAVLPVELTSFTALNKGGKNLLNWQTATEANSNYFKIQKSKDGIAFTDIGSVKGHGTTTTPQYYSFIDDNPFNGINYYRLAQIDNDGKAEQSKAVSVMVTSDGKNAFSVYPNPTHNILTVEHDPSVQTFEIVNTLGQVLKTVKPLLDANKTEIGTIELANGIYFLRVNQTEMIRFVKF